MKSPAPLCVDLDGTLIATDVLWEGVVQLLRRHWQLIVVMPLWLYRGKANFKTQVSAKTTLDIRQLPYRTAVIEYIRQAKRSGRRILLITAAHERLANKIAGHIGLFDEVIATTDQQNMSGQVKGEVLSQRFGVRGFDYMGNAKVDLNVWRHARRAIVVDGSARLITTSRRVALEVEIIPRQTHRLRALLQELRPHQWVKNLLVFVPAIMAHELSWPVMGLATVAWLALNCVASSLYLVNDLLDLQADRQHPRKRWRPLAAGTWPLVAGIVTVPVLCVVGMALSAALSLSFLGVVILYAVGSLSYSLWLKRVAFLDVIILSMLYMVRLVGGAAATSIPISRWLLLFSICFFLSLALLKRFIEVDAMDKDARNTLHRRGYEAEHREVVMWGGITVATLSVAVLALYIWLSPQISLLYSQPLVLAGIIPLVAIWLARVWYLAAQGTMHDDPVAFAVKDKVSYCLIVALVAVLFFASL